MDTTTEPARVRPYETRIEKHDRLQDEFHRRVDNTPLDSGSPDESHLAAIARLVALRAALEEAITIQVEMARIGNGHAHEYRLNRPALWSEIGAALGTSGQAANQRYGKRTK